MGAFIKTLLPNILASYKGGRVWYHVAAILLTALVVSTGFDWEYFTLTSTSFIRALSFPGVLLGSFLSITIPLCIIAVGEMRQDEALSLKGWMVGQAAFIGLIISSTYKAFTGRIPPEFGGVADISRGFNFGFLRHGIFWGWPSSHTATAFALAVAFFIIFSKSKWRWLVLIYALYVGLGVSTTIHWFSEFAAGALVGTAVGLAVGKSLEDK
ncbi:phosphatase PAP2 family protein [Candidatus Parcubacteria bacterium]|nr:phosphatase PAP2 family protein [Candidatus Parcubacteria bacterium]